MKIFQKYVKLLQKQIYHGIMGEEEGIFPLLVIEIQ
jgi:hypothetical protein